MNSAGRHSAKTGGAECEHLGIAEIRRAASAFLESRDPNNPDAMTPDQFAARTAKPATGPRKWSRKVNSTPAPCLSTIARASETTGTKAMKESPIFTTLAGKPLKPGHHLARNSRGKFMLRLTLQSEDKKLVGRRETFQLRTPDPAAAMSKRDAIIEAFKQIGILCRDVVLVENVNQNSPLTESADRQNIESE